MTINLIRYAKSMTDCKRNKFVWEHALGTSTTTNYLPSFEFGSILSISSPKKMNVEQEVENLEQDITSQLHKILSSGGKILYADLSYSYKPNRIIAQSVADQSGRYQIPSRVLATLADRFGFTFIRQRHSQDSDADGDGYRHRDESYVWLELGPTVPNIAEQILDLKKENIRLRNML